MRVLLLASSYAGRAARATGRYTASAVLAVPYALGWIAGLVVLVVVLVAVSIGAAARLGWSDVRRGGHGAA